MELWLFDFDGTLYSSTDPPGGLDKIAKRLWLMQPASLNGWGPPSSDPRWDRAVVESVRRGNRRPDVVTVLLTARKGFPPLVHRIKEMLAAAGATMDHYAFKPILWPEEAREYKATVLADLLRRYPQARKVVLWDDEPDNIIWVGAEAERHGLDFAYVRGKGWENV